mgnify:CR=1 FL=1
MSNLPKELREIIEIERGCIEGGNTLTHSEKEQCYQVLDNLLKRFDLLFSTYLVFTQEEAERLFNDAIVIGRKSGLNNYYPTPEELIPQFQAILERIKKERTG